MASNQDKFEVLRKIDDSENSTQRLLSSKLGFSLGKLNYCLKSLKQHLKLKVQSVNNS